MQTKHIFDKKRRDLDPQIWSLARKADLGELRKIYHAQPTQTQNLAIGVILLMCGIAYLVVVISAMRSFQAGPAPVLLSLGLLLILPGSILAWPWRYPRIYLWEAGFLYEKGRMRKVFRWDQVESLQGDAWRVSGENSIDFSYKVRRQDGYEVTLNKGVSEGLELANVLLEAFLHQVAAQELPVVPPRSKIFGQFKLDHQGISDKQETLSWQDIQELSIEAGNVIILKPKVDAPIHEYEAGSVYEE